LKKVGDFTAADDP